MKNGWRYRPGGRRPYQMLNAYEQAVYYQLTALATFANLAAVIPTKSQRISALKLAQINSRDER